MRKTLFLLISALISMSASAQHYAKGSDLVTSVKQLSSDISSSTEGSLSKLLDGVVTGKSFWSTGKITDMAAGLSDDHYHYLQVDLGKECHDIFLSMSGRRDWYPQFPTAIKVEGSNDQSTWTVVNDNASNIATPWVTDHKNYLYALKEVYLNTPYRYVRISFLSNINGDKKGNYPCAQLGEFQVYEGVSQASVTVGNGYTTLCSDYPLDFRNTDLKAYIIKEAPQSGKIALKQVTCVPAHTGIIVSGSAGTYTIPVAATSDLDDVSGNKIVGVGEDATIAKTNAYLLTSTSQFASDFPSTSLGGKPDDRFLGLIDNANENNDPSQWRTEDNIPSKDRVPIPDRQYHYLQVNLGGCYQNIELLMQKSKAWSTVFPKTIDILATNDLNGEWTTVKTGFHPTYKDYDSDDEIDLGAKYQYLRLVVKENHATTIVKADGDNYPIFLLGEIQIKGVNTQTFALDNSKNGIYPFTADTKVTAGNAYVVLTSDEVSSGNATDGGFQFGVPTGLVEIRDGYDVNVSGQASASRGVYNLRGQKVVDDEDALRNHKMIPGIYVVKGKKIVVK